MTNSANSTPQSTWVSDLQASVVLFLVAMPLCLGIALASGAPVAAGLLTGIIGGIVVGSLAGSPLQVSGPAAGLTVICIDVIHRYGIAGLGVVVFFAGILQIAAGALRLGKWFRAVSPAVIHGMLSGIGVLILAGQMHALVDEPSRGNGIQNLLGIPASLAKALTLPNWNAIGQESAAGDQHFWALVLGTLTIAIIMSWSKFASGKLRMIPGALVGILVASVLGAILNLPINRVPVPERLSSDITWLTTTSFSLFTLKELVTNGLLMATIASAETLLCATAVDKLHSGPRTKYDRELFAQGVGNVLCGTLGVLPMTGVIVRSAANVQAGAKTRLSSILHGVWLIVFVVLLSALVRQIPVSALAGILVYTGFRLIDVRGLAKLWKSHRLGAYIFLATVIVIVSTDLLTGVITGILLSALKLLLKFGQLEVKIVEQGDRTILKLNGAATFLKLPLLATALGEIAPKREVHVSLDTLTFVDHACLELLVDWGHQYEAEGGKFVIDWDTLYSRFNARLSSVDSTRVAH